MVFIRFHWLLTSFLFSKVFGEGGAAGKTHDTVAASSDDLWAQRMAMEDEPTDDDDD